MHDPTRQIVISVLAASSLLVSDVGCKSSGSSSGNGLGHNSEPESSVASTTASNTDDANNVNWSEPVTVATGDGVRGHWRMNDSTFHYVDDPTVAVDDDGETLVAWVDNRRQNVYFQRFDENGKPLLDDPVDVSRSPDIFSWLPRLASSPDGDEIYVLWQEIVFSGGTHGGEAFFSHSTNGGETFSEPRNLSQATAGCGKGRLTRKRWDNGSLDIALGPDGEIYTAWTEYQGPLRFRRSVDGGESFSKDIHVAGSTTRPARAPSLAVAPDGTVHLAWTVGEVSDADIRLASSTDRGMSFGDARVIFESDGHSDAPKVAVDDGGTTHVVFSESREGPFGPDYVLYTRTSADDSFVEPRDISGASEDPGTAASFPTLAVDGDDGLHVVWEHHPTPGERARGMMFSTSNDDGDTFSEPTLVPGLGPKPRGVNGSLQGKLMRKLAVTDEGDVRVVNSTFVPGVRSVVELISGTNR